MIQAIGFPAKRLVVNLILNFLLVPGYIVLFCLTTVLALTPIFPARIARANLRKLTGAHALKATMGTSLVLFHYILVVLEDFIFWPMGGMLIRDNPSVHEEAEKASQAAHSQNQGLVILSAHFGNIEVSADSLRLLFTKHITPSAPLIALAKPSKHAWATRLLAWYRQARRIEVILTNRKDLVRAMLQALKQGRALALLVDQKPAKAGLFVNFFGQPAAFPEGGVELAMRTNSEFFCFSSRRLWPGVYTFEGKWLHNEKTTANPPSALLQAYANWLENTIKKSFWQWCWDYNKWSRKPLGTTNEETPVPKSH